MLSCEQNCGCFKLRCCLTHLSPQKDNWCECSCCKQSVKIAPAPVVRIPTPPILPPPRLVQPLPQPPRWAPVPQQQQNVVITVQPISLPRPRIPTPPPRPLIPTSPPRPRKKPVCEDCCSKVPQFLLIILFLFLIILLLFFSFLEVVQIRFVLSCVANDALMNNTQVAIVQNYLKIFQIGLFQ